MPIVQSVPYPWSTYFDENESRIELDVDKRAASISTGASSSNNTNGHANADGTGDVHIDEMLTWSNDDWAVQLSEKEKKMENRNPWAGKNPYSVTKFGKTFMKNN